PRTLWGYQPQVTDEALYRLADALSERDARVATLEKQLQDLRRAEEEPAADPVGALHGLEETGVNGSASRPHEEPGDDRVSGDERPEDRAGDREEDEPGGRAREDRRSAPSPCTRRPTRTPPPNASSRSSPTGRGKPSGCRSPARRAATGSATRSAAGPASGRSGSSTRW